MEIVEAMLMGCGALALLTMVSCVGLVGVGTYAVDQAIEEEQARQFQSRSNRGNRSTRPQNARRTSDPFGEYQAETYDDDDDQVGGWGDDTQ